MKQPAKLINLGVLIAFFALLCAGANCTAQVCAINYDIPGYYANGHLTQIGNTGAQKATNYFGQGAYPDSGHNFWNAYAIGGTTGTGTNSDGATVSPMTVTDNNAPANSYERTGTTFVGLTNLESPYVFAKSAGPALVTDTINNVPQGTYNIYLYGKNAAYNSDSTVFSVSVGATSYGSLINTNAVDSVFTLNNDYVVFSNIVVSTSGGVITFTYAPNTIRTTEGDFNGFQLVTVSLAFAGGPQYFSATPGNGHVSLSWLPVSTAVNYNVYRGTTSGGETLLASGVSATSYNDTSVANGTTYYYYITAVNSGSTESPHSTELTVTPLGPPPAPTWVSVTAGNPAQIDLSWVGSPSATGYYLLRGTVSGTYTVTNFFSGSTNTNYVDTSVLSGTTYYYVVYGTNISGAGPFSVQNSATPSAPPVAPTALNAQITASSQITLTWASVFGATSYNVYRGTTSGGETLLASSISGTNYVDNSVVNGTTYYYEVTAVGAGGQSVVSTETSGGQYVSEVASGGLVNTWWNQAGQWSNNLAPISGVSYVMAATNNTAPNTYYGVTVGGSLIRTAAGSTNDTFQGGSLTVTPGLILMKNLIGSVVNVNLIFTNYPATTGLEYPMVRLAPSTSGGGITTLSGTITNLTDSYLADDEQAAQTFKITSTVVGTSNIFVMSSSGGVFTVNNINLLTGDWSGFGGTLNIGNLFCGGVVELSNSVPGMPNMALNLVNPQGILNLDEPVSVQSFNDSGFDVSPGTYTASALNALGDGGTFNGTGSLTIGFTAPVIVSATTSLGHVNLSWTAISGAVSYNVYRGTSSGGETLLASGLTSASYVDSAVANGVTYYYEVTAVDGSSTQTADSPEVSIVAIVSPLAPSSLVAFSTTTQQVTLSWIGSAGATSYNIYRGTTSGGETLLVSGVSTTNYVDNSVVNGTTYYYEVTAVSTGGQSANSNESSVRAGYISEVSSGGTLGSTWNQGSQWVGGAIPSNNGIKYIMGATNNTSPFIYYGVSFGGAAIRTAAGTTNDTFLGSTLAVTPGEILVKDMPGANINVNLIFPNTPSLSGFGYPMVRVAPSASALGVTTLSGTITNLTDSYLADDEQAAGTFNISSMVVGVSNIYLMSSFAGTFTTNNIDLLSGDWSGFSGTLNIGNLYCGGVVELSNSVPGMPNMTLALVNPQGVLNLDEPVSVQSFNVSGFAVSPGTYTAAALTALGDGGTFNGTGSLTIGFTAPVIVSAKPSTTQISLSWTAISGAVSYNIYRGTSSGGETLLASGLTSASYVDSAVTSGVIYYYEVTAVNGSSTQTADSPEVSAALLSTTPPHITGITLSGTSLSITAANGNPGGMWTLVQSTNLTLPINQWTPVLTNTFDSSGNLNLTTNIVNPANAQDFYLLEEP